MCGKNDSICDENITFTDIPHFVMSKAVGPAMDSVRTFAIATHNLISKECPHAFGKKSALRKCITGSLLLSYIRSVSFEGYVQKIKFNAQGDVAGRYAIIYTSDSSGTFEYRKVGDWNLYGSINIDTSKIRW